MSDFTNCRIESDGTALGTRIIGSDGADITGSLLISEVTWTVKPNEPARVQITGYYWGMDAVAQEANVEVRSQEASEA